MKLYYSALSPFARKVLILARLHGLDIDILEVSADGARGYTDGVNPLGKIPALSLDDGRVIFDSPVICQYIDSLSGNPLLSVDFTARIDELTLHALGDGIATAAYNYRYEVVRDTSLHWQPMIERHETAIIMATQHLETRVETLGTEWRFGNLAIVCALDYTAYRAGHLNWQEHAPRLAGWHDSFKGAPHWSETNGYD